MTKERFVACMRWGEEFPASYVNVLYNAVCDHLDGPFRFICFTNDSNGIVDGVEIRSIAEMGLPDAAWAAGAWPKISIFAHDTFDTDGRVLFIDLDTIICGSLECFFDESDYFRAIGESSWTRGPRTKPFIYRAWRAMLRSLGKSKRRSLSDESIISDVEDVLPNTMGTGIFSFNANAHGDVFESFVGDIPAALSKYTNEQHFVEAHLPAWRAWPEKSICSFKYHLRRPLIVDICLHPLLPPKEVSIIAFHGAPRPIDLALNWHSSSFELPHIWLGRVKWVRDYWSKYSE